jgi:hypothetical protein
MQQWLSLTAKAPAARRSSKTVSQYHGWARGSPQITNDTESNLIAYNGTLSVAISRGVGTADGAQLPRYVAQEVTSHNTHHTISHASTADLWGSAIQDDAQEVTSHNTHHTVSHIRTVLSPAAGICRTLCCELWPLTSRNISYHTYPQSHNRKGAQQSDTHRTR